MCVQSTGRELPGSMSLLNPIMGEMRSDSVHKMSTFSTSRLLSEGKFGQKGKEVAAFNSKRWTLGRIARYLSLIIHW